MDNLEELIKKQEKRLGSIEKEIKTIKRVYLTSLVLKLLIIILPIIGIIISIPRIMNFYKSVLEEAVF